MGTEQAHRLNELDKEKARPKGLAADPSLDKAIRMETAWGASKPGQAPAGAASGAGNHLSL